MSTTTPDPSVTGKGLFEGTIAWRGKDSAADNFSGGLYSHVNIEFSATEATEWISFYMYISWIVKNGGGALQVYNNTGKTLPAGTPVRVSGFQGVDANGNPISYIVAADANGNNPATFVLSLGINNGASGLAYIGGVVTASGFNTLSSAVNAPVFLAVGGGLTLTEPSDRLPDATSQIVGYVASVAASGQLAINIQAPRKIGKSFFRGAAVDASVINGGGSPAATGAAALYTWQNCK